MNATLDRLIRRKATWEMDAGELARVVADHCGWEAAVSGGWIHDENGRALAHGWERLGEVLESFSVIKVGSGIDWLKAGRVHADAVIRRRREIARAA